MLNSRPTAIKHLVKALHLGNVVGVRFLGGGSYPQSATMLTVPDASLVPVEKVL